jgi:hypothetical protein
MLAEPALGSEAAHASLPRSLQWLSHKECLWRPMHTRSALCSSWSQRFAPKGIRPSALTTSAFAMLATRMQLPRADEPGLLSKPLRALPPPAAPHGHECGVRPPPDDEVQLQSTEPRCLAHAPSRGRWSRAPGPNGRQRCRPRQHAGRPPRLEPPRGAGRHLVWQLRHNLWQHGSCHTRCHVKLGDPPRAQPGQSRSMGMITLPAGPPPSRPGACPGPTLAACVALPAPRTPENLCSRC